jgi:hypothetical protein
MLFKEMIAVYCETHTKSIIHCVTAEYTVTDYCYSRWYIIVITVLEVLSVVAGVNIINVIPIYNTMP